MENSCPYCATEMNLRLSIPKDWRRVNVDQHYEIFECKICNFGHIYPRPSAADISEFYVIDDYYTHQENRKSDDNKTYTFLQKLRHHLAWRRDEGVDPTPKWWASTIGNNPLSILEIGCGNGQHLKLLSDLGHDALGIEPDKAAVETAVNKGCTVYRGSAEEIPTEVQNKHFDVVLLSHVLEHTLDPVLALQNSRTLLSDNGRLIIEVPNNDSLGRKIIGKYWAWLDVPRHLNFFGIDSLKLACAKSELKISDIEYRGYNRQFSSNWLATEKQIFNNFENTGSNGLSEFLYWRLFFSSAFAGREKKYDSVRVIASKAG